MRHLGVALMAGGKFSAAIPILEESLGISANANGVRTAIYVSTLMPLAEAYESAGRVDEAEKLFTQALAISIEILPPSHLSLAEARYNFGKFLMRRASMARAKPMLFEAENARIAKLAADDPVRLQSIVAVAAWQISEPELSHANDSRDAVARLNQVAPFANNFHPLDKADWLQVSQRLALAKGDTQSAAQLLVTRQETLRKYLHTGDARLQTASLIFSH